MTTLADVGWWVRERFALLGLDFDNEMGVSIPRILYSAVSDPIDPPDVRWWIHNDDYVIQRGDFMTFDVGVRYLDYFSTDYKRNAYVVREGEESVPGGHPAPLRPGHRRSADHPQTNRRGQDRRTDASPTSLRRSRRRDTSTRRSTTSAPRITCGSRRR